MELLIITTLRCNLKCAHCLHGDPEQRPDFPVELLPRLLIEAKSFGGQHVALTGGEPGLHPALGQMIEIIVGAGYTWSFVSNGMVLEPYSTLLEEYGQQLRGVTLSLDGAMAATHNAIRRHPQSFERVLSAARHYVNLGIPLSIHASFNRTNQHELGPLVTLASELGAKSFRMGGTIPTPWNASLTLTDRERHRLLDELASVRANYPNLDLRHTPSLLNLGCEGFSPQLPPRWLSLDASGRVLFCCNMPKTVIGALSRHALSRLLEMRQARSLELQQSRAQVLENQAGSLSTETCAYCCRVFDSACPELT